MVALNFQNVPGIACEGKATSKKTGCPTSLCLDLINVKAKQFAHQQMASHSKPISVSLNGFICCAPTLVIHRYLQNRCYHKTSAHLSAMCPSYWDSWSQHILKFIASHFGMIPAVYLVVNICKKVLSINAWHATMLHLSF